MRRAHRARGAARPWRVAAMSALLSVVGLRKTFVGRRKWPWEAAPRLEAVKGVDLEVGRGEALGIVGESGCGKSTLARMIVGLLPATAGEVRLDGAPIWAARTEKSVRARLQMVFQDPLSSLNPRKTVGALVAAPMIGLRAMPAKARRERVAELMDLVGLRPEFVDRYPHELSGGQCQRIGIARALATEAEILVLDEPVSALDVSVQAQILALMAELRQRLQLTYLFISHDLAVVGHLCDRVAVMSAGEVVELGTTEQVLTAPRDDYTRLLIDSVPGKGFRAHAAA